MSQFRQCSRTACSREAVATLTYVYSDSTAVLGPLAVSAEPHSYDLCQQHASRLTAPRGWEVVRVAVPGDAVQAQQPVVPTASERTGTARSVSSPLESAGATSVRFDRFTESGVSAPSLAGEPSPADTPAELDEYELRRIEISQPLTKPDDDWSAIADVVRNPEPQPVVSSPIPEGFIPPEAMVQPRHAATPEPLQQGEVARRGHLRMLRDDS